MSQEIKFRVWDKLNRTMYTNEFVSTFDFESKSIWVKAKGKGGRWLYVKDAEIMQFTSLIDKNGKDIFEGDFVTNKTKSFTGNGFRGKGLSMLVEWDEGECFYSLSVYDNEYFGFKKLTKSSASDIEVIGNIYENPELLGGVK